MLLRLLRFPALLGLTACSVYTPLQVPAPLIDGPRQVEVSGGLNTLGSLQGAAVYSPCAHVLLRGAGAFGNLTGSDTRDSVTLNTELRTRQLEAALGTYWRPSPAVLLGGFAGYGLGRGAHSYLKLSGLRGALFRDRSQDSIWTYQYQARYRRLFAEAYLHWFAEDLMSVGVAYRIDHVRFRRYVNAEVPTDFRQMWYHEPTLFFRFSGSRQPADDWVNAQLGFGYGFSPGFRLPEERAGNRAATEARKSRLSITLSLVFQPHLLWQRPRRE
ncbi:hypothetical protein EJV47_09285 [Hymenobacter gummosus]|uniref:Outer membrane protein beta-barrel domain-containing protein n=1 Tax=Hymenobacter gummosus TaxID=1776032 RepID=A0A431U4X0_9BACT|nr:hypothetical protein [Hymenobacter gummosus]RTQ50803.1 hypothetical protein EJV47_09285 [Hymenobacter gummosus]